MKQLSKTFITFLTLLAGVLFIGEPLVANADLTFEEKVKLAKCEFPANVKNIIKNGTSTEFTEYLRKEDPELLNLVSTNTAIRVGSKTSGGVKTYYMNRQIWADYCVLVYGTPQDVPTALPYGQSWKKENCPGCANYNHDPSTSSTKYEPQYLGITEDGFLVPNLKFPDQNDSGSILVKNVPFVKMKKAQLCSDRATAKSLKAQASSSSVVAPTCSNLQFDRYDIDNVLDGFYLDGAGFPRNTNLKEGLNGYFDVKNRFRGESIISNAASAADDRINQYAELNAKPKNWSYGVFTMWHRWGVGLNPTPSQLDNPDATGVRQGGGYGDWWYQVYYIMPRKCPSDVCGPQNNASVKALDPVPTTTTVNKDVPVKLRVRNDFKQKMINAPCAKTDTATVAGCYGDGYDTAYIKLTHVDTGKVVQPFTGFTYDIEKESFKDFNIPVQFPSPGKWKVTIVIPHYKTETNLNDNTASFEINVKEEDALIANKSKKTFTKDENVELKLNVTNNMSDKIGSQGQTVEKISDQSTHQSFFISIKDKNTLEEIYSEEINFSTDPGQTKQIVVTPALPTGKYVANARIPYYDEENGTIKWNNNSVTFNFEIERSCLPKPQPPENLECKGYDVPYAQNKSAGFPIGPTKENENEDKIIKMCIGMYPNHPSTTTEGGQGAFFIVNYRFFPMPLPPYEVRTVNQMDGGKGYCQVYSNTEVNNRLGEDDAGEIDSYVYYPTDDSIGANNYKNLAKPYIVGPHSFKHYKYRGRMVAREVDFTFEIIGPDGKTKEASGSIKYKIPDKCYVTKTTAADGTVNEGIIDFKQVNDYDNKQEVADIGHCRELYFYLPIKDKTAFTSSQADLEKMHEIPKSDERIQFKNPGIYTFNFEAKEKQEYRYQEDLGKEFQGKVSNSGLTNKGLPRKGITNPSELGTRFINQRLSEITIDKEIGQTPKETTKDKGATPNESYQNRCYLEQDGFDRTAFDAKNANGNSDPKGFGLPSELNAKMHSNAKHICFHDHSIDYHYWLYDWSEPKWYTDGSTVNQGELIPENYGLNATYYNNSPGPSPTFGTAVLQRIDGNVNFNWGQNSPAPEVGNDYFGVRWTGYIYAPVSGTYTFRSDNDDGVRLWVNNSLIINKWVQQNLITNVGTINLQGGRWYPFKMEAYENQGNATSYLLWSHPGDQTPKIIPSEYFGTTDPN